MPDQEQDDGSDAGWTVRLREAERLEPDEGDLGEDYFGVEFELSGLGVSGSLTATITDPADETTVITEAFDQLQDGLETFARVVGRRKAAGTEEGVDRGPTEHPSLPARVEAHELLLRELIAFNLARAGIVDRARMAADAIEREAVLSGDERRREHAAEVRAAVERLTE